MEIKTLRSAQMLWEFMLMNHKLQPADIIIGLGSHDIRTAERAVEIYNQGLAPIILFSGGLGSITKADGVPQPESVRYKQRAIELGVPDEKVILETNSTNSEENVVFTRDVIAGLGLSVQNAILVSKPYMEKRTYATFKNFWPELNIQLTSPQLTFEEYSEYEYGIEKVINIMVGDLQRIKIYPQKGFQIEMEIPKDVWDAYEYLVSKGFTDRLVMEN